MSKVPKKFTKHVRLYGGHYCLDLIVEKSENYLESTFMAWCKDEETVLVVNGWNFQEC